LVALTRLALRNPSSVSVATFRHVVKTCQPVGDMMGWGLGQTAILLLRGVDTRPVSQWLE